MEKVLNFVLASGSAERLRLLRGIGLEPLVISSEYKECRIADESPEDMVMRLAEGKARAVLALPDFPADAFLIAADTVVAVDGDILGKPRDISDARAMLGRLSGREHRVLTGLALARVAADALPAAIDLSLAETRVRFRVLDDDTIHAYLEREEALCAAGSYRVQGLGVLLLDPVCPVTGSWSNIAGLPLELLAERSRSLGLRLL
ncbi:MAG: Maf family protein [Spirochaetota bacterium]|jgi:septum formation protein|nr:Maf family protein [Spirochaetota bacterium]